MGILKFSNKKNLTKSLLCLFLSLLFVFDSVASVLAIAPEQKVIYDNNSLLFDVSCGGGSSPSSVPSVGSGSTIILDPGHSPFNDPSSRNSMTGLYDNETSGGPGEMHNAWIAANKIKKILVKQGYTVKLTKKSENESINLSQRAERANSYNGAILFTIHADSTVRWLAYPDSNSRRVPNDGPRRDGTDGLVHPEIESPSKDFAEKMAPIIAKGISKGGDPYDATSFNDFYGSDGLTGNGLNPGNTPVQTILSSVPEVYSEVSPTDLPSDGFAKAAAKALSTVVKPSGGGSGPSTPSASPPGGSSGGGGGTTAPSKSLAVPAGFSLDDKIGQLLMVGLDTGDSDKAVSFEKKYQIGGFLLNDSSGSTYTKSVIEKLAIAGKMSPLFAIDEEGGQVQRFTNTIGSIPSAKQMGSMSDDQVKSNGKEAGQKMSDLGINIDFAPVLDLDNGKNNGAISKYDRSFSSDPATVSEKAGAFSQGLQAGGVAPVFKHFPGLGSANINTDDAPATTAPLSSLKNSDLKPYKDLVSGSNLGVMMGNQTVPGLTGGSPASLSKAAYNLLKNQYGFGGVIFTDDLRAGAVGSVTNPVQAVVKSLQAGAVMPLFNFDSRYGSLDNQISSTIDAVKKAVNNGSIKKSTIENDLAKVVALKSNVGAVQAPAGITQGQIDSCSCPSDSGGAAVSGSISPQVGNGMSADAQQKFQQIVVAAGTKFNVDPNYVATFYYTEMGRTGDSTNNADAASGTPVTGDGKWIEPAPPVGHGGAYIKNSSGYWEPYGLGDGSDGSFDTMGAYGKDGDGDGKIEPNNLADAAFTAANLLAQDGATVGVNQKKLHDVALLYNHSDTYAQSVVNTYNYLTGKGSADVSGSSGGCASSSSISGSGTVEDAVQAARILSNYKLPYSQAHRTMTRPPQSGGYDCSASVSWVLLSAGFTLPRNVTWGGWAPVSGDFETWGDPGPGKEMTVWANGGHVFIEFKVPGLGHYELNTAYSTANGLPFGSGPQFFKWGPSTWDTTSGFTPRHWRGT